MVTIFHDQLKEEVEKQQPHESQLTDSMGEDFSMNIIDFNFKGYLLNFHLIYSDYDIELSDITRCINQYGVIVPAQLI